MGRKKRAGGVARLEDVRAALVEIRRRGDSDGPPGAGLRKLVEQFGDPGAALAGILARDPDDAVSEHAMMLLFLASQERAVPERVRDAIGKSAVPVLRDAMGDASVSDERKYSIGPALDLFGAGLDDDEFRASFKDPDRTAEEVKRKKLRQLPMTIESVEMALSMQQLIDREAAVRPSEEDVAVALQIGLELCGANSDAGVALVSTAVAIAIEHGKAGEHLQAVVERLAETRTRRAAWFLRELGSLPCAGEVGARSRELAQELARTGVSIDAPPVGTSSHGLASSTDGSGSRSVVLFYRTPEGGMDALALLLNDTVGVKDVWSVFGHAADLDRDIRARTADMSYVPCTVDFCRELVADALAVHAESGRPFPGRFLLYRHYLGEAPLALARRAPRLGAYMLETYVRAPGLVEGTEQAFEDPLYGRLWAATPEAYDFVRSHLPVRAAKGRRGASVCGLPERTVDEYVTTIASKERDILARRIAVNLEVEALGGRASKSANRAAARVWIALTENVVPFEGIPFVQCLCMESIAAISENVRHGYSSQEESNSAALERDADEAKAESELDDPGW